jgi:hypothetical protein
MGAVMLMGFLTGKGARSGTGGKVSKMVKLSTTLLPLVKLVMKGGARR